MSSRALLAPDRDQRCEDGAVIVGKVLEHDEYGFGFDAWSGTYRSLIAAGIIGPTKIV